MIGPLKSLRGLTVAFLALFLTVTIAAGTATFLGTRSAIDELVERRIEKESLALVPARTVVDTNRLARRIGDLTRQRDTGDLGLLLLGSKGQPIAGNVGLSRRLPLGFSGLDASDHIKGLSAGRVLVRDIGKGNRLAVFAETEPVDHYFAARARIYLAGFGAIVAVVLCGLLLFRRLIGQRIDEMRQTVESIIDGDLSRRVPINGDGGEFDQQAAAFNRMLDRINALMGEIRNVSNDISHELRTPLARLRNELAQLELQPALRDSRNALAAAKTQADDLLVMFAAILRIAEVESGSRRAAFQSIEADALIEDVAEMMRPVVEEGGRGLKVGQCDTAVFAGDRQLLLQMFMTLVENSCRHTSAGTKIQLSVTVAGNRLAIIVEDDGTGIPADRREAVMRRFGTADHSRHRGGHGLGLPLAEAIARLHGGALALGDARPGLRVTVTLPLRSA
jgi:signal transduction histidine kinase